MNGYVMQTKPNWNPFMVIACLGLIFSGPWGWLAMYVSYKLQSNRGNFATFEGLMTLLGIFITGMVILIAICLVGTLLSDGYNIPGTPK